MLFQTFSPLRLGKSGISHAMYGICSALLYRRNYAEQVILTNTTLSGDNLKACPEGFVPSLSAYCVSRTKCAIQGSK